MSSKQAELRLGIRARRRLSVVVAASLAIAACSSSDPASSVNPSTSLPPETTVGTTADTTTPTTTPETTVAGPPSIESAGATHIRISPGADWLAIADGHVWTAAGRGIVQLDPVTGEQGVFQEILGICLAFDVGYDSLWVGGCDDPAIWRIEPAGGEVIAQVPLDVPGVVEEGSVAAGEGGVWVISTAYELIKVDPATNAVVGSWPLPAGAAAVRAGLGSLWVTVSSEDVVLRIDPSDPSVQVPIPVGDFPRFLAVGDDAVWVMNQRDGSVTRVAGDGSVVATIDVGPPIYGGDIAVGGGSVWVQPGGELLVQIDPATNQVVATFGPPSGSGSVAADDAAVWVSAHDVLSIWRLPLG